MGGAGSPGQGRQRVRATLEPLWHETPSARRTARQRSSGVLKVGDPRQRIDDECARHETGNASGFGGAQYALHHGDIPCTHSDATAGYWPPGIRRRGRRTPTTGPFAMWSDNLGYLRTPTVKLS